MSTIIRASVTPRVRGLLRESAPTARQYEALRPELEVLWGTPAAARLATGFDTNQRRLKF